VSNFISIGLFCLLPSAGEKPQFLPVFFLTLAFSGVASWQQPEKVEHGAQLQTFPYPMASKLFLSSNAFMAKSGTQSLTFKSMTDRETDKKNSTFLAAPAAGEIRAPPNLAWR